MSVTITSNVEVTLEPEAIADAFAGMDCEDQAIFFNEVARIVKTWTGSFELQMAHVSDEGVLSKEGREVMRLIGQAA
jgi:hypothetical protein